MHGNSPGEASFPLGAFGGLVTLAVPESLPEGASPRTWNTDFYVGQVKTRDGLRRVYTRSNATVGPNAPASASSPLLCVVIPPGDEVECKAWANPTDILGTSGYASFAPASFGNSLLATEFGFALGADLSITGITVKGTAYASAPATLQAQLVIAGVATGDIRTVLLGTAVADISFGSDTDLWGLGLLPSSVNSLKFGVQFSLVPSGGFTGATGYLQGVTTSIGINTGQQTMQPFCTFVDQDGTRWNGVLDSAGDLWFENLDSAPNVLTLSRTGIAPNSRCVAVENEGVQYLAFVQPGVAGGSDMPLQWTPTSINRITQVGPGLAPKFTPSTASSQLYPILSITQPAAKTQGSSYFLQSAGPGSNQPGNVVTFYYLDSTVAPGPDADLVAAFNSGTPTYVYASFTGTPTTFGPQVVLVTAVGEAQPPGQPRNFYYFTFQVASTAYTYYQGSGNPGYTANYQRTLATLTTSTPIPNAIVGSPIAVTGATPTNWNSTWTISQTPNASEMSITGSQITAGVATFNYAVTNGTAAPAVGELVTITNTLNASGQLNVSQWPIATATGGDVGSFTVDGYSGTLTAGFQVENGYADTAGTIFDFDPGAALVGTTTSPIYGNAAAGGDVVFNASGIFIDPGTYQGTVFFILPDGSYTAPAPPVVFTVPNNTTELVVTNLVLGPPNAVGRGIAITEAGQNGVPGANFFTLPNPVVFYVQGAKQTATSFFVNDNSSIATRLFFTSYVLNSATAIDIYGYNLFNLIEIGDPAWIASYAGRNFYGQCLNRVQNFLNLSFDGGYLASTVPVPAGWSQPDTYGKLEVSPVFGNAYYIENSTAGTLTQAGLIQQSAYQDVYQVPILNPNTGYSARVWARIPSGNTTGSLVVALVAGSAVLGSYTIPFSSMTTAFQKFSGVLLADPGIASIPANAVLQVYASGIGAAADVEIDRMDIFETDIPVLWNTVFASYAGLPTMVDAVTGEVVYSSENQQPVQAATVLYDTLYAMKGWAGTAPGSSLYSLQESSGMEPADWNEPEVSQRSGGAIGPFAWAAGEQWLLAASRTGVYLFVGGQPGKIMQEVQQIWDAVNWNAGASLWMDVDLKARRILIGLPLPTPNFWLPDAPVNAAPTSPNVVLMCNFQGLDSGEALRGSPQVHTTMFGTLMSVDMRRKWSLWTIESPGATTVQGPNGEETRFGNGQGNSMVYALDSTVATDAGTAIDSCYTTAGVPILDKRAMFPQLGQSRVTWSYLIAALTSGGKVAVRLLGNRLIYPEPTDYLQWTIPGGFTPTEQPPNDVESSLNFQATRTFIEFRQNDGEMGWTLSNAMLRARKNVWNAIRGVKS